MFTTRAGGRRRAGTAPIGGAALAAAIAALLAGPTRTAEAYGNAPALGGDGRGASNLTAPESEAEAAPSFMAPAEATTLGGHAAAGPPHHRIIGVDARLGVRGTRLASLGFDPFSRDDGFVQASLALAYRAIHAPNLDLSVGIEWDYGLASADARDSSSSLEVHELAVALCGRVPLSPRFAAFARLTPGAARVEARVTDASALANDAYTSSAMTQKRWLPSAAASAGLAFRFASVSRSARAPVFDYWFTAEAGYHYSPSYALELRSVPSVAADRNVQPLALGDLSLRGGFARFGVALTF